MAKLYPPVIEGAIPAFYANEDGTVTITIPFSMNRAVSKVQVEGFAVKIKTVQSSTYLYTLEVTDPNSYSINNNIFEIYATFTDSALLSKLKVGQFYKLQIAYISGGEIGYYSTVGIAKYTTKPVVEIPGLEMRKINPHRFQYMGTYSQAGGDTTERVYTYRFDLYGPDGTIIETSGDLLHNSSNDTELDSSYDEYNFAHSLTIDFVYQIQYTVITVNKLTFSTPKYRISQQDSLDPDMKAKLIAEANYENGYIDLSLQDLSNGLNLVSGGFVLSRASEMDDYAIWNEIYRWRMFADIADGPIFRDFSVEQGKHYRYAVQQYNADNLFSNKIISNICQADFEDAFLYDGHRQLKIRFNPKVSSFKVDVLETKTDTIGAKHPFIFRNGRVSYKEFPISGLISYYSDEDNFFVKDKDIALVEKTTDLTSENMLSEREFKLQVLDWLTDGKPKLFRSPGEGNYIVRLLNVSLTPQDPLGRMLHTFNCTAYEVAENIYQNLSQLGIISIEEPNPITHPVYKTIELFKVDSEGKVNYVTGKLNDGPVDSVRFTDMMPGDKVIIDGQEIIIGVTGAYYLETRVPIQSIEIPADAHYTGAVTLSTQVKETNTFDRVEDVELTEIPGQQLLGGGDVFETVEGIILDDGTLTKNPKIEISSFYNIHARLRDVLDVCIIDGKMYSDPDGHKEVTNDSLYIYRIGTWKPGTPVQPGRDGRVFEPQYYYDPLALKQFDLDEYDSAIYINGEQIDLWSTIEFNWRGPGKLESLVIGNGVLADLAYQTRLLDLYIEDAETEASPYLEKYNQALQNLEKAYLAIDPDYKPEVQPRPASKRPEEVDIPALKKAIADSWYEYLKKLAQAIYDEDKREGRI